MSNLIKGRSGLWEVVIGLEIHAQVSSKAKLFSNSATTFAADPNTQVSFVDAGMPGMLPVINSYCVDQAIKSGLGLNGKIEKVSIFDRKNYFYADLPTGYQISQFYHPIVTGGYIDIDLDEKTTKRINITRLHMEQDAGKSTHDLSPTESFIDLNRAGIALMEIVSEPEMHSAKEAQEYVKKIRSILRYLGTCDGNMDEGSFRIDVNVSLHKPDTPFGDRAEIKNINSVKFVGQAIEYEIVRQLGILEDGGSIAQETRLFDPAKGETRSMRSKESAHDYRYFPDPDLKPLILTDERIEKARSEMVELPDAKKARFMTDLGLTAYDADVLVVEKETADFYENILASSQSKDKKLVAKQIANWLTSEVFGAMNRSGISELENIPFKAEYLAELVDLIVGDTISGKIAKDVFAKMWETGDNPNIIVEKQGLKQVSDPKEIENVVANVLERSAKQLEQYKAGKETLFGFFVGQVMKDMKGKANPGLVNEVLKKALS
ncbi:MAG: Asp-tRNA(Asn)/Glu-tRNA(Gln) amidotransferase GatCAB subunit B [Alphaproteobacteria bacterium CG_4_10_14_0_8_um_filter_37_21]|nr:MAG: Asp-tRNA(Asn)/Glu-tRNA(Gln) amidotransferase GatCAB subunit B [Alphaproteobacteria bacterium CG_4_10_14_0_8_um_filter_37_21]